MAYFIQVVANWFQTQTSLSFLITQVPLQFYKISLREPQLFLFLNIGTHKGLKENDFSCLYYCYRLKVCVPPKFILNHNAQCDGI